MTQLERVMRIRYLEAFGQSKKDEGKMYIIRVETKDGARRYAYGCEKMALARMHEFAEQPDVLHVTMELV